MSQFVFFPYLPSLLYPWIIYSFHLFFYSCVIHFTFCFAKNVHYCSLSVACCFISLHCAVYKPVHAEYLKTNVSSLLHESIHSINPLNAKLNPICHLLALLGAHHIFHVSGVRVKYTWISKTYLHHDSVQLYLLQGPQCARFTNNCHR
jgi:hypothetical protein